MKESLGFIEGMVLGMSRDHGLRKNYKVFDWVKAAKLIREHCMIGKLFNAGVEVSAGLQEDWGYTSGAIFRDGNIVKKEDTYVYLSSSWATPIIDIDGEEFDCWILKGDSKYESDTYWPSEAENLLFNGVLSIDA